MTSTPRLSPLGEAALRYAQVGMAVFPIFPGKKTPLTEHGFKDATKDPATIGEWWAKWPDANVGIATGAVSGIFVVDVDPRHSGNDTIYELQPKFGKLPDTRMVRTGGGGTHFYFKHPGWLVPNSSGRIGPGVDVRADGGYVLAPPSITDGPYEVLRDENPLEAPGWLFGRLKHGSNVPSGEKTYRQLVFSEGQRNNGLTSLAGKLHRDGLAESELLATLHQANGNRCDPPLPTDEVEAIAKSVARYAPPPQTEVLPEDPLARVLALEAMPDKFMAAQHLLQDWSFIAALREADLVTFDLVAAKLHQLAKITKPALKQAIERFSQQLRPAADPKAADAPANPPELIEKAEKLLADPKLLDRFHASLARDGVVGEEKAATTILLAAVTRKTKRPVHLVLKAASSSGKNFLTNAVISRLPKQDVITISDMSPHALQYLQGSLRGKVVVITEHEGAERAEYPLRIAMSEGSLSILAAEKVTDEGGSRIESRPRTVEGPACFITTTTRSSLHDENETRILEVPLDESPEQTKRINEAAARRAAKPPSLQDEERAAAEIEVWRCALGMLDATGTINPFAVEQGDSFPSSRVRSRRDFQRFLGLTAAHALLHQRQRQHNCDGLVVVEMQDVVAVKKLCRGLFGDTSPRLRVLQAKLWAKFGGEEFKSAEAAKILGYSTDATRRVLREMEATELVEVAQQSKGNRPATWKLVGGGEPDCPTEPDSELSRTNSSEITGQTTEPDCPTDFAEDASGTNTDPLVAGDQQPPADPGRTVGQTDFGNDFGQVTQTEAEVGQSRAVGRNGNGAADLEQTANGTFKVNSGRQLPIIDVMSGETEEQAEARTESNARCAECGRTDVGVSVVLDDDSRVCRRCWSGVRFQREANFGQGNS